MYSLDKRADFGAAHTEDHMKLTAVWQEELLARYGCFVAKHPIYFLLLPTLVSVLASALILRGLVIDNNLTELYSAQNGHYAAARPIVESKYPVNYSTDFEEGREIHFRGFGSVLVSANDDDSVLRPRVFAQIEELDQLIQSIEVRADNASWTFKKLCARAGGSWGSCFKNHFFLLKSSIPDIERGLYRVRFPLQLNKASWTFQFYGNVLGGVSLDEEDHIKGARSALLTYHLDPKFGPLVKLWEHTFLETLRTVRVGNLSLVRFSSASMVEEFGKDILAVLPYFALVGLVIAGGMAFLGITRPLCLTRVLVGLIGVSSMGITTATGFSIGYALGVNFVVINLVLPFFALGISLCDTLAQIDAWQATDCTQDVGKRMGEVYRRTCLSSAVLAITNILLYATAFHMMPMLAVSYFARYALVVMAVNFVHQHTYVAGLLAFFGQSGVRWNLPQCLKGETFKCEATPTPEISEKFLAPQIPPHTSKETHLTKLASISRKLKLPKNTAPCLKIATIALLIVLLGACVWQTLENFDDFDATDTFKYDSYVYKYWDTIKKELYYSLFRFQVIIDSPIDYANESAVAQVESLMTKIESAPFMDKPYVTESWLRYFKVFLEDRRSRFLIRKYNLSDPQGFIKCLRHVFFRLPPSKRLHGDLVFSSDFTSIVSTRYQFQCRGVRRMVDLERIFRNISTIAASYPFKVYFYHPYMGVIEISRILKDLFMPFLALSCFSLMIVMFLLTFDYKQSLFVGITYAVNVLLVEGLSSFAGIRYNPTSVISWVITLSFSSSGAVYLWKHLDCRLRTDSPLVPFFESPIVLIFSVMMISLLAIPFKISAISDTFLFICILSLSVNIVTFKLISMCLGEYWNRPFHFATIQLTVKDQNIDLEKKTPVSKQ